MRSTSFLPDQRPSERRDPRMRARADLPPRAGTARRSRAGPGLILPLLLPSVFLLGERLGAQEAEFRIPPLDVQERVLDNGVRVLVLERPNHAGRVAARVFYKSDIAGERPGTAGLTHMLEHHLFKGSHFLGTTDWEAERDVAERVERTAREMEDEKNRLKDCFRQRSVFSEMERACTTPRLDSLESIYEEALAEQDRYTISQPDRTAYMAGGATGLTGSTGRDWMKYHADLPANRLELFMWIERSRVDNPVFRQFDPEKQVVIEQIRRAFNRADASFNRNLRSMTYLAHPYGWAHWFSDLEGATREDHWEIYYKFFTAQNTTLVVVGDIGAEEVFALAERYWGDWPPARPSPRLRTVEPEPGGERRLTATAAAGPAVALNVAMPAIGHPDLPALDVLAELLGGRTGLLMRRLGDEAGLATGASASTWTSMFPSHFSVHVAAGRNADLPRLEAGLGAILEEIAHGGAEGAEVSAAAGALTFGLASAFDDPGDAAVTLGSYATIYDWRIVNELPRLWSEVTPDDLARVVGRYFAPDRRVVGVLHREEAGPAVSDAAGAAAPLVAADAARVPPAAADPEAAVRARAGYDPLRQARPGSWPAGGAVEEFDQPLEERLPAAVSREETTLPPLAESADRWRAWGALIPPRAGDPLPVAENVWYVPPWMAVRRGILDDRETTRPQRISDIRYREAEPFTPPAPEDFRLTPVAGMEVFLVRDDFLPLVRLSLLVDVAPLDDPDGMRGLSRLAMDVLIASGTERHPGSAFQSRLDELGLSLQVSADDRRARIDLFGPSAAAAEAVSLLGALVSEGGRDAATFQRLKERAVLSAGRAGDDPAAILDREFERALLGADHPLAAAPTPASIGAIGHAALTAFLDDVLTGARLSLAVSGAVERAELQRWAGEAFRALRQGEEPRRPRLPAAASREGRLVTAERASPQAFVRMGWPTFAGFPEDHAAFEVMNYILCGAGQGSWLFQRLRTERGLTAASYCEADPRFEGATVHEFRFNGNPATIADAVAETCVLIRRMRDDGLTPEEFERGKAAYLEGHIPSSYRTPHLTALRSAEVTLLGRFDYLRAAYMNYYPGGAGQIADLGRLTRDDVNAAARNYLRPDQAVIAVVGPQSDIGPLSACTEG